MSRRSRYTPTKSACDKQPVCDAPDVQIYSDDPAVDTDRRYFKRFPQRRHRLRLAGPAEIADRGSLSPECAPVGHRAAVVARHIGYGVRLRVYLWWPAGDDTDIDEDWAREIFEVNTTENFRRIEDGLRGILRAEGLIG